MHNRKLHWLVRAGFVAALALTLLFGVRTVVTALYWNDPAHHDQSMEGWMPIGYVGRSWHVPREVLAQAMGIEEGTSSHRNLDQIARERAIPLAELIAHLTTAIDAFRESHP